MDLATPRNSQLIDAFRSLAMLHVVFAHALIVYLLAVDAPDLVAGFIASAPFVFNPVWHTYSVDIFFMLSALLIGLPLLSEYRSRGTIGFRAHFLRRATRILPLSYLTLAIYLLVQDPPLAAVLPAVDEPADRHHHPRDDRLPDAGVEAEKRAGGDGRFHRGAIRTP